MDVLLVTRAPPSRCGIAEYSSMLVEELGRVSSVRVRIAGNVEAEPSAGRVYREPYSGALVYKCFRSGSGGYSSSITNLVLETKPDVVHIQHDYSIFPLHEEFLEMLRRLRRVSRVVVTMHTVHHLASGGGLYARFQRAVGGLADAVVVHSPLQEFELLNQGVEPGRVHRIPHGTLINPYLGSDRGLLLRELGIDLGGEKLLVVPGFIRRDKGLDLMLDALRVLRRLGGVGVRLVVWGDTQGDGGSALDRLPREEGLTYSRGFLDRRSLLKLLASADLVVLPYVGPHHYYSVSGAFHLSIGSFKPVVCTRAPKLVECYELAPGLVVPSPNPARLAEKILSVLTMAEDYSGDVKALIDYATRTSWRNVALMHAGLYKSVVEGEGHRFNISLGHNVLTGRLGRG